MRSWRGALGASGTRPADPCRARDDLRRGPEGQPLARLTTRVGHRGGLDGSDRYQDRRTGRSLGVDPRLLRWPVAQLVKRTALMRELQAPYPAWAHRTHRRRRSLSPADLSRPNAQPPVTTPPTRVAVATGFERRVLAGATCPRPALVAFLSEFGAHTQVGRRYAARPERQAWSATSN